MSFGKHLNDSDMRNGWAVVVERAAHNSIQDLYGLKASSRSMKALAERCGVLPF
ncbi:unnamed protein product, partial [Brassica rapa subsp. narinosa]